MEYIAALMLESMIDQWRKLLSILRDEALLDALRKLDLIHPYLQVSACPRRANFGIIVSSYACWTPCCPKCNAEPTSPSVFLLDETLSRLKQDRDKDLPAFAAQFLIQGSGG